MKKMMLLFLMFPVFVFGQGWERTFENGWGRSVEVDSGDGYIIAGSTFLFGYGYSDVYMMKINDVGDSIWAKTFGTDQLEYAWSICKASDDGYLISGDAYYDENGENSDILLLKIDDAGSVIWSHIYDIEGDETGRSVIQTSDNGYLISGWSVGGGQNIIMIKTDQNGDSIWVKDINFGYSSRAYSVVQANDGGYVVCGYLYSENAYEDILILKTDESGEIIWSKTYGGAWGDVAYSIQQTNDLGYIISGSTGSFGIGYEDVFLLKTDINGDSLWLKTFGGVSMDAGLSVLQNSEDDYVVTGYTGSFGFGSEDLFIMKTDGNGDSLWFNTYGGIEDDRGLSILQTDDNSYIVAGYTNSFGNINGDVYVIKTDNSGNITSTTEIPLPNPNRKLIKTINLQGREIQPRENIPYIEVYDDGSTEKKVIVK